MAKIVDKNEALLLTTEKKLLLISGCFDVLHLGHLRFINEAKKKVPTDVDLLIVVLSDHEVSRRKGLTRPIFNLQVRVEMLTYLSDVTYVLPWEGPWEKLRDFTAELKPKYMAVVEGDPGLENKKAFMANIGAELLIIDRIKGFSTSEIIAKFDK